MRSRDGPAMPAKNPITPKSSGTTKPDTGVRPSTSATAPVSAMCALAARPSMPSPSTSSAGVPSGAAQPMKRCSANAHSGSIAIDSTML